MQKCARQRADDPEPSTFPQIDGAVIGTEDEVELHGAKAGSGTRARWNRGTLQ
jgi:hypothetical protein